jgi:hypothetical protein
MVVFVPVENLDAEISRTYSGCEDYNADKELLAGLMN